MGPHAWWGRQSWHSGLCFSALGRISWHKAQRPLRPWSAASLEPLQPSERQDFYTRPPRLGWMLHLRPGETWKIINSIKKKNIIVEIKVGPDYTYNSPVNLLSKFGNGRTHPDLILDRFPKLLCSLLQLCAGLLELVAIESIWNEIFLWVLTHFTTNLTRI